MTFSGSIQDSDTVQVLGGHVHPKGPEKSRKETVKPVLDQK